MSIAGFRASQENNNNNNNNNNHQRRTVNIEHLRLPRLPGEQPRIKFRDNLGFREQRRDYPLLADTRDRRTNHQVARAPTNEPITDHLLTITRDGLFMVDSGGQYLDGTTDVTRTFHYGTPTDEMIDRYTEVLQVFF